MTKQEIIDALMHEIKYHNAEYKKCEALELGSPERSYHSGWINGLAVAIDYVNTLKSATIEKPAVEYDDLPGTEILYP